MPRTPLILCTVSFMLGVTLAAPLANAGVVNYEGNVWPENAGFERVGSWDVERRLNESWFEHDVELGVWEPPPYGECDYYRHELASFAGEPFFIQWRMISDAPSSEVDHQNGGALIVLVGGPVTYHFNVSSDLVQFYTGYYPSLYVEIESGVAHTYRLEVYGGDYFEFQIDGIVVDSGLPEDVFPTSDALMSFGTGYYRAESTSSWDYVRFGRIPEPATGLLLLTGVTMLLRRRRSSG